MKPQKQLYQWDVNQYLTGINPAAQYVDYTIGNEVIRLETDGTRCRIPDEVLQTYGGKTCYERYPDGTYRAYSFTVLYAPKPPDYIYTAEERTTFDALVAKADAAIAEIKSRADSGEFTPVKGVDYFTDAEKAEMMESVSSGAVGEFRKVVDSATAEYNANASEKLTTYDTNAEQHTGDYNRNAEVKLEAYNSNHTEKVAEYNQNAETKTAEFDSNAAALQTEVDRLRGECDTLAAENRKQENRIDALIKLNKGQTYDILPEDGESASRTAPSGAKYVSVDKLGGKSVVWNQLCNPDTFKPVNCTVSESSGIVTVTDCGNVNRYQAGFIAVLKGHKYYQTIKIKSDGANPVGFQNYLFLNINDKTNSAEFTRLSVIGTCTESGNAMVQLYSPNYTDYQIVKNSFMLFDLTLLFGAGNEPTAEQFEAMFPAESYPYNPGEIISSRTATITAGAEAITTGFPELKSAGTAHDEIDLNEGKLHQRVRVVDLGTLSWSTDTSSRFRAELSGIKNPTTASERQDGLVCAKYPPSSSVSLTDMTDKGMLKYGGEIFIKDIAYTDATAFKESTKGVMLYYELAEEVITDIEIPTELTDWLEVEAGGSVTFHNSDDSKQLAVPNAVSWVRKLNEVE